eukprot:tig00001307_g8117.t1
MFAESRGAEPVPAASVQRVTFEEYRAAIQRVKPGAVLLSRADIEHVKYILENPDAPEPSGSPEHVKRVKNWREFMRGKYTLREVPDPTDNLTAEELAMPNPRPRRKLRLVVEKQVDNRLKRGNSGDAPPLGRELVCDEDIFICIQREHLESGHKGGTGVYNNAKQRYAIPRYLVRIYVKICPVCKLKNKRRQPDGILHPIKVIGFWDRAIVDFFEMPKAWGPCPRMEWLPGWKWNESSGELERVWYWEQAVHVCRYEKKIPDPEFPGCYKTVFVTDVIPRFWAFVLAIKDHYTRFLILEACESKDQMKACAEKQGAGPVIYSIGDRVAVLVKQLGMHVLLQARVPGIVTEVVDVPHGLYTIRTMAGFIDTPIQGAQLINMNLVGGMQTIWKTIEENRANNIMNGTVPLMTAFKSFCGQAPGLDVDPCKCRDGCLPEKCGCFTSGLVCCSSCQCSKYGCKNKRERIYPETASVGEKIIPRQRGATAESIVADNATADGPVDDKYGPIPSVDGIRRVTRRLSSCEF